MSETKPVPPSHFEAQQRELAERKAEARREFLSWALDVGFFGWFKEALRDANVRATLEPRETERIRARLGDKIRAEMHHFAATSGTPYPPVRVYVSAESSVLDVAFLPILFAEVPTASGNCSLCELGGYTPHKVGTPKPQDEGRQWALREMTEGRRALVAQAFGELVGRIYNHAPKGLTIRTFARSMHAALGERIPDA